MNNLSHRVAETMAGDEQMGYWMKPESALLRVVEDPKAPIMQRVKALKQVENPPRALLRRLLLEPKTPRAKPIPSKLRAVAALKYAQQCQRKKIAQQKPKPVEANPLGIT